MAELELHGGRQAEEAVDADPFWRVVRRRHPDVSLVVLPPDGTPSDDVSEEPAALDVGAVAAIGVEDEAIARDLWAQLTGLEVPAVSSRWTAGHRRDTVRRETTLTRADVADVDAVGIVVRAERELRGSGWRTVAPADGLARVMAGREPGPGRSEREELQLVHAPAGQRLVLRWRAAAVPVDPDAVTGLLREGTR